MNIVDENPMGVEKCKFKELIFYAHTTLQGQRLEPYLARDEKEQGGREAVSDVTLQSKESSQTSFGYFVSQNILFLRIVLSISVDRARISKIIMLFSFVAVIFMSLNSHYIDATVFKLSENFPFFRKVRHPPKLSPQSQQVSIDVDTSIYRYFIYVYIFICRYLSPSVDMYI